MAALAEVWDRLLAQLEAADPVGLEQKRRDFRAKRYFSEVYSEFAELTFASWLVEAGVTFKFGEIGGTPQPDFVLAEWDFGVEIGSRSVDGANELLDDVESALHGHAPEQVEIEFDTRPLAIRERVRQEIVDRVRADSAVEHEAVPAHGGHDPIRVRIHRRPSPGEQTTVRLSVASALLAPHLADVEAEIRAKVIKDDRKRAQAESMPTILVVDISRCGIGWVRPPNVWAHQLASMLDDDDPYVAIAVMITDLADTSVRLAWAPRSGADDETAARLAEFFDLLGGVGI